MDDRELDKRFLLLYNIRCIGVRHPTADARPCWFPAKGAADPVEYDAGYLQSRRVRSDSARTVPCAQQIRPTPFGVRDQVSVWRQRQPPRASRTHYVPTCSPRCSFVWGMLRMGVVDPLIDYSGGESVNHLFHLDHN